MKQLALLFATLAIFNMSNVFAQNGGMDMGSMSTKAVTVEGVGVVEGVDQVKGVVTLSHEPIASLNWPAMTMDFAVENKTILSKLIVGKKVNFQFIKQGNHYIVTGVK